MSARSLCVLATAVLAGFTIASRSSNAAEARYDVTAYGAKADGTTLDTAAIQAAIDACAEAGGGRVVLPKGRFLSGSLALKSGVRLVIEPEATLVGSRSLDDYPTRRLIRAEDATDIGIEGGGTIDGQGQSFWQKRERTSARPTYRKTAQFDYEPLPRPSFIHFVRCRNVVVHNVRLQNSPAWTVHLQRCQKARMEKVVIRNPLYGPNTDGIDINSCIDVEVRGCDIITGDDGVVLKSTEPGHDHPSRNITVEDCRIWSACNTLKIGTETHDRFENIVFRNCHLYCDSDDTSDRPLAGVAIESVDGAHLSNITATDLTMHKVRAPLFVRLGHRGGNSPRTQQVEPRVPGRIENVTIRNIQARKSLFESSITGIPGHPVQEITLENLDLQYEGGGNQDWILADVPEEAVIASYPEAQMFGRLPAYGLYCRHVEGLRLSDVQFSYINPDPRPMLVGDDIRGVQLTRVRAAAAASPFPLIWLRSAADVLLQQCIAPAGTAVFAAAEGSDAQLQSIRLEANRLPEGTVPLKRLAPYEWIDATVQLMRPDAAGRVIVEAEAMRLLAPMTTEADEKLASGKFVVVPEGNQRDTGMAVCRFEVGDAGDYQVWVRALGPSEKSNSLWVSIDRGPCLLVDIRKLDSWSWVPVREQGDGPSAKPLRLGRGEHTLQLISREPGTQIDGIAIVPEGAKFDPTGDLGTQ